MSALHLVMPWILCSVVSLIVLRLKLLTFWDLNVSFGKSVRLLYLLSIFVFTAALFAGQLRRSRTGSPDQWAACR